MPNTPHIRRVIKTTKKQAQITKRVYPHLFGMPIEQMQKFLGHSKLETTQLYAESSTEMLRESLSASTVTVRASWEAAYPMTS